MKVNGKEIEGNVDMNDARAGWKYPIRSKEISKACKDFFKKRGIKQCDFVGKYKK